MTISCRLSIIDRLKVNAVSEASVLQLGDARSVELVEKALAIQRMYADFYGDEGNFSDYPIFSLPLPELGTMSDVAMTRQNTTSAIRVGNVRIVSVSASSYIHAGCAETLTAKSRIKHIRQFNR